jgi:uncharacterized protein (TIGR02217 family)
VSNAVFPALPGLTWDVKKTPRFSTLVQTAASGREVRAALWTLPLYEWTLAFDVLRDGSLGEIRTLMGFFLQRQGGFDSFLYSDPTDNAVANQQIGTGDGSTTAFQLVRSYGGFAEPILDLNGTPTLLLNGAVQNPSNYAVSATGLVTFTAAPAAGAVIGASFAYYFRVRFKEDMAEFGNFLQNLWELKQIVLVRVKP